MLTLNEGTNESTVNALTVDETADIGHSNAASKLNSLFVKNVNNAKLTVHENVMAAGAPLLHMVDYSSEALLVNARDGNIDKVREILSHSILHDLSKMSASANYTTILPSKKYKIDLEIKDLVEQTPLNVASRFDYKEICVLLIEYGAQVNTKDKDEWSPLLNASRNGNYELAELFLRKRALVEKKDTGGFTPLMWACYKNNLEIVKLLLKNGADPNAKCKVRIYT